MAQTLMLLGKIQLERGKAPEAETTLREAVAIMTTLAGRESVRVADILAPLSQSLTAQGKLEEAEKLARETVAIRQAKQEPGHSSQSWALRELDAILRKRGDYTGAEPVARQIVEWRRKQYGPDHEHVAAAIESLADLLRAAGKNREADEEISKANGHSENFRPILRRHPAAPRRWNCGTPEIAPDEKATGWKRPRR